MAEGVRSPLLNPVLSFLDKPVPNTVSGGGKNSKDIIWARLDAQKKKLSKELRHISEDDGIVSHSGKIHLLAKMFDDSLAPSWIPDDLFETDDLTRIVAPAFDGYLVEISGSKISSLIEKIERAKNGRIKVDISRLESIIGFDKNQVLRGRKAKAIFEAFDDVEKQFNVWVLPFHDKKARVSVKKELEEFANQNIIGFGHPKFDNVFKNEETQKKGNRYFPRKLDEYLIDGILSFTTVINSLENFNKLISSGIVYRIEPVHHVSVKSVPPGSGKEPIPNLSNLKNIPTVVIVDGGCSAVSYLPFNVMSITPLVDQHDADLKHGNKVTSVICQGSAWNNNLALPELECKFISVQAINKKGVAIQPTTEQFINYLRDVANETNGVSQIWNLSFNESEPYYSNEEISYLGHEVNRIAREFNILPIISIGNVSGSNSIRLCPPADCESALTIAGRCADENGMATTPCSMSLRGPAPAGMKKPELSWFSTLRMIGGVIDTGTSYSTPLISSIAAHAFKNLKEPTPDLVRALLINKADRCVHDLRLGWGSPWKEGSNLPWYCDEGTVTLAWNSKIRAGFAYYWNDIFLPTEMLKDGKIKGEIILTAILKPLVSELGGENYFATRLQCSLQSISNDGKVKNLLGTMKESKEKELRSRQELAKWSPIRHHGKSFSGVSVDNTKLRLYARIFTRDLYQFDMSSHHELSEQEVSFVLTFKSHDKNSGIYNSVKQRLGPKVEVGIIEQDIDIDNTI
ncbi:S8 family serine peptidase [Photorhabdus caribbeanensis]|uniref:S8 family serine peptidase n=1 Tax=Photorhabdus caribbeanensis TaxID=1004165 RepID=UPI001BD3960D|nr:S8 family serine peptidase [Photorhabdus caribbeanensis]MBS9424630.1 hypothetical protein [Photorhabdus caribbeanensis]